MCYMGFSADKIRKRGLKKLAAVICNGKVEPAATKKRVRGVTTVVGGIDPLWTMQASAL